MVVMEEVVSLVTLFAKVVTSYSFLHSECMLNGCTFSSDGGWAGIVISLLMKLHLINLMWEAMVMMILKHLQLPSG